MALGTILINQGSGTGVIVDDVSGNKIQMTKLDLGSEGKSVLNVKAAVITATAADGTNQLVAAVASKVIKPIFCIISSDNAVNVRFLSGSAGTAISGWFYLPVRGGFVIPGRLHAAMKTASGMGLFMQLSAGVNVGGLIEYVEE